MVCYDFLFGKRKTERRKSHVLLVSPSVSDKVILSSIDGSEQSE